MAASIDTVERMAHKTLLVDHKSGAHDAALPALALHFLVLQDPILGADFAFGVRQKLHRQSVLVAKRAVAHAIVHANPEDHGIEPKECVLQFAKIDGLDSATGGV